LEDFAQKLGSGALFEARSWGEVGRRTPNQILHKPEVFDSMGRFRNNRMMNILEAYAIFM
jgi:hypothetical protein